MKLDRLFNVLVLGGAAIGLGTACGEENVGGGGTAGGTGEGGATSSSSNATTGAGGAGGAAGTGGAGGVGGQSAGPGGAGGAGGLECPEIPSVDAPCGCPCCWVTDCANTDADCCTGFCETTCC